MGAKIIISYILTFFLILVGKCGAGVIVEDAPSSHESASEWYLSVPEKSAESVFACANLNSFSANSNSIGSIKFTKYVHTRHACRTDRTLTVFNRSITHQISELLGTSQFLIILERLLI